MSKVQGNRGEAEDREGAGKAAWRVWERVGMQEAGQGEGAVCLEHSSRWQGHLEEGGAKHIMLVSAWDTWGRAQKGWGHPSGQEHDHRGAQGPQVLHWSGRPVPTLPLSSPVLPPLTPSHASLLMSFISSNCTA